MVEAERAVQVVDEPVAVAGQASPDGAAVGGGSAGRQRVWLFEEEEAVPTGGFQLGSAATGTAWAGEGGAGARSAPSPEEQDPGRMGSPVGSVENPWPAFLAAGVRVVPAPARRADGA